MIFLFNEVTITALNKVDLESGQEGSSISRQNLNLNPSPSPHAILYLPGYNLKTGFINPHPLSLGSGIKTTSLCVAFYGFFSVLIKS